MPGSKPDNEQAELATMLNPGAPFGPATADEFESRYAARFLYDDANEIDEAVRKTAPVFLIGRRGSGKTAFLRAALASGELAVDLNSPELISQVGEVISELKLTESGSFVERIAPIWEACFISAICSRVWSDHCRLTASDCPDAFAFGRVSRPSKDGRATDIASQFLLAVRLAAAAGPFASVNTLLDSTEINGVPLWAARQSLIEAANKQGCMGIVSLDSLDQYNGIFYKGGILASPPALALQALFRAAAQSGRASDSIYRVRVSFPAELWSSYSTLSSNPLKDFDNSVLLHWDSKELIHVAALRFLKFLEVFRPDDYAKLSLVNSNTHKYRWAQELLSKYLPRTMTNGLGTREPTISYLLRHTQLLPRHFIHILNRTFSEHSYADGQPISEQRVRSAVSEAELLIADAIIDAFKIPYPELEKLCEEVIPQLSLEFSEQTFHQIVNHSHRYGLEYEDILGMFVEVGVLGRKTEQTTVYSKADFEYLHENRMFMTEEDTLCLHPLFTARFDSRALRMNGAHSAELPIYPLGSDPTSDEFSRYVHLTRS